MVGNLDRKENESQLTDVLTANQVSVEDDEGLNEATNVPEENTTGLNENLIEESQEADDGMKSARSEKSLGNESNEGQAEVLNQEDDATSQISDDQENFTIVNNENNDYNNDSAYETNEINSQNGSNSRIQSANTNDEDVDNETGENFLLRAQDLIETEKLELMRLDALEQVQNIEIEEFESELANPPTTPVVDDVDVILSAENTIETGDSTTTKDGNKEV